MNGHSTVCGRLPRVHGSAGFTLVELMIAMLLGLVVIAGVSSVFLAGQQSYRTNSALSEVQDSSRVAFELMARDIRDAGLTGCTNSNRVANVLNNGPNGTGTDWWADWANAVHGYDVASSSSDPALAALQGAAATDQVPGTPSLQLIGAAESGFSLEGYDPATLTFTLNEATSNLAVGNIVMVCNPDHATILQIDGYAPGPPVTFTYAVDAGPLPQNCSAGLGYQTVCTASGNPGAPDGQFGANAQVALYNPVDWYIGVNPAGSDSLYRISLQYPGGVPTPVPQEMVRNVTGMTITYLENNATTFVSAEKVTNWNQVTAVQVSLKMASTFQRASVTAKPLVRTYTATTTLRNRVD